ncbi:MAG: hypothetical protein JWQ08_1676 [Deinococcus sp.]|nr:hypothetical protein [Deinococcus sp.]
MTDTAVTDSAQTDTAFMTDPAYAQTLPRPPHLSGQKCLAPLGIQIAETPLPSLTGIAEQLRRLQLLCAAQSRRLDELEARESLIWPARSPYAHLEIDP